MSIRMKDARLLKKKNLSYAEDDLVAAQELAEEAGGEVEGIHLEEVSRQCAPNRRHRVQLHRCVGKQRPRQRRGPRRLGLGLALPASGGDAAASEPRLLPGRGALEGWGLGRAGGGHWRWLAGGERWGLPGFSARQEMERVELTVEMERKDRMDAKLIRSECA